MDERLMDDDHQSPDGEPGLTQHAAIERRNRWIVRIAVVYFAVALFTLLMPMPFQGRVYGHVGDLIHIPTFGIANFIVLLLVCRPRPSRWMLPITVTIGMLLVGVLIEILQSLLSRSASLGDVVRNACGATAALFFFQAMNGHAATRLRPRVLWVVATGIIFAAALHPAASLADIRRQKTQFPVLASFSHRAELQRWYFSSAVVRPRSSHWFDSQQGWEVKLSPHQFPAIKLQELERDWSGFSNLVVEMTHLGASRSAQVEVQLRIGSGHTRQSRDRKFFQRIVLSRGEAVRWNIDLMQTLPETNDTILDFHSIRFVELMAVDLADSALLEFGGIWLE